MTTAFERETGIKSQDPHERPRVYAQVKLLMLAIPQRRISGGAATATRTCRRRGGPHESTSRQDERVRTDGPAPVEAVQETAPSVSTGSLGSLPAPTCQSHNVPDRATCWADCSSLNCKVMRAVADPNLLCTAYTSLQPSVQIMGEDKARVAIKAAQNVNNTQSGLVPPRPGAASRPRPRLHARHRDVVSPRLRSFVVAPARHATRLAHVDQQGREDLRQRQTFYDSALTADAHEARRGKQESYRCD
jgi:hypothetical protein